MQASSQQLRLRHGTRGTHRRTGHHCAAILHLLMSMLYSSGCAAESVDPSQGKASLLLSCLPKDCLSRRTVWNDMLQQVPPCIAGQRVWWSRHAPRLPITLVTQLSLDRLPALEAQCQSWAGPLAAAVFVPLLNPGVAGGNELSTQSKQRLHDATSAIQEVMDSAEDMARLTQANIAALSKGQALNSSTNKQQPKASCQLRIILLYEVYQQEKAMALYPVNSLRNYARLLADTPLIANIDVDMLPSLTLAAALLRGWTATTTTTTLEGVKAQAATHPPFPGSAADLILRVHKEKKAVFVLPAFETSCEGPALADKIATYTKPELRQSMQKDCTVIFRYRVMPKCHNATNFRQWFSLQTDPARAVEPYLIQYEDYFEPWFIGSRNQTEWFDVRYRGYGKNKIEQVAHQAYSSAVFYVHPTGFLIHRPHDQSMARKVFLRVKFKSKRDSSLFQNSLYKYVEEMWEKHSEEMKTGRFKALVDDTLTSCLAKLPWWTGMPS